MFPATAGDAICCIRTGSIYGYTQPAFVYRKKGGVSHIAMTYNECCYKYCFETDLEVFAVTGFHHVLHIALQWHFIACSTADNTLNVHHL